ncbi:MAG: hypothetical protein Q4P25_05205 [Tissierellia bacterium]|nr:hypothetical protein [Tissierellia bacterium]
MAILGLYTIISPHIIDSIRSFDLEGFKVFLLIILFAIIVATYILSLFVYISSYRRELYRDKGYLTFTLPIDGSEFVGSKLIVATIWSILATIVFIGVNAIGIHFIATDGHLPEILHSAINEVGLSPQFTIFYGLYYLIGLIQSMLLMYFTITISRIIFKQSTWGVLWFVFYLILSYGIAELDYQLFRFFPYAIKVDGSIEMMKNVATNFFNYTSSMDGIFLNVISIATSTIVSIILYLLTSYLINKKLDI